jgi:hypothetical protein
VFRYIIEAVHLVAQHGHKLLHHYRFDPPTGLWLNQDGVAEPPLSLHDLDYSDGSLSWPAHRMTEPETRLDEYLKIARHIFEEAGHEHIEETPPPEVSADFEHLRWFPLPGERTGP